jgi:hypothetical protein
MGGTIFCLADITVEQTKFFPKKKPLKTSKPYLIKSRTMQIAMVASFSSEHQKRRKWQASGGKI